MRMNAAETSASRAIVDWTPLAVVSRSLTTDEIETFMSDVSTTSTNIAIASRIARRVFPALSSGTAAAALSLMGDLYRRRRRRPSCLRDETDSVLGGEELERDEDEAEAEVHSDDDECGEPPEMLGPGEVDALRCKCEKAGTERAPARSARGDQPRRTDERSE